jgi:hypothetical protein
MVFASYGFYIKKFIDPFPLQFAIDTINTNVYALFGAVLILLFGGKMFIKPSVLSFFCFWTLLGLLPAAAVSCTDIAWTPWAERYLYFSMVPLSLLSAMLCVQLVKNRQNIVRKVTFVCAVITVILFAIISVQRAHVWNDDLTLSQDTFAKSPSFIPAAVFYACSLREKGLRDEAEQQLRNAELLPGAKHQVFYNLGLISISKGDSESAKRYFLGALAEARNDKKLVLMGPSVRKSILLSLSGVEMIESKSYTEKKTKQKFYQRGINYLVEAYREDASDPFLLYNIAKLYLFTGNRTQAKKYFEEFIKKWDNDIYRQTAVKLLKKL